MGETGITIADQCGDVITDDDQRYVTLPVQVIMSPIILLRWVCSVIRPGCFVAVVAFSFPERIPG